jgi:hypothetical protein
MKLSIPIHRRYIIFTPNIHIEETDVEIHNYENEDKIERVRPNVELDKEDLLSKSQSLLCLVMTEMAILGCNAVLLIAGE